jgi:hypothetical protein
LTVTLRPPWSLVECIRMVERSRKPKYDFKNLD